MRWMVWNGLGCILWLAGLAYAKGVSLLQALPHSDDHQLVVGLSFGVLGLLLIMWVNIVDAS